MNFVINKIITGDYKNGEITLKGINADEPMLVLKAFFNKKEILMDKTTIKSIRHSLLSMVEH